jgi:hypothetical protein
MVFGRSRSRLGASFATLRLNASEGSESGVAVARGGVRMSCVGAGSPPQTASGHAG